MTIAKKVIRDNRRSVPKTRSEVYQCNMVNACVVYVHLQETENPYFF